jgi:hypothetical protein
MNWIKTSENYLESAKESYTKFFSIFPTEMDFLHHLFFVNGNGYDWENGALVELTDADYPGRIIPDISFEEWIGKSEDRELYPLCEYAKCVNIPDNIKKDWLEKLELALDWAEKQESFEWLTKDYKSYKPKRTNEKEDRKYLQLARKRIKEIRNENS